MDETGSDGTRSDGTRSEGTRSEGTGIVVAVCVDGAHRFSKAPAETVRLLTGLGVEGDAHLGATVRHRSRVRRDPAAPNLRQVHLLHAELLDDLATAGFALAPGELGENLTTRGIDLIGLGEGAVLRLGASAVVRVTGLRNPCRQIEDHAAGPLRRVVRRSDDGRVERLAGVMAVVEQGGQVRAGDPVAVVPAPGPHHPLRPV